MQMKLGHAMLLKLLFFFSQFFITRSKHNLFRRLYLGFQIKVAESQKFANYPEASWLHTGKCQSRVLMKQMEPLVY